MDTLALLCNLHADGPETLQRLRSAGWDTLRELQDVDLDDLGEALGGDRDRAVRFQREAEFLRERLGDDGEEPTPAKQTRKSKPRAKSARNGRAKKTVEPAAVEAPAPVVEHKPEERRKFTAVQLPRESVMDRPEAGANADREVEAANECSLSREHAITADTELERPAREVLIPQPAKQERVPPSAPISPHTANPDWERAATVRTERLDPTCLDGLDAEVCRKLGEAGISDLRQLGEAPALELSAESGVDYTRLLRLQFLARREIAANPESPIRPKPNPNQAQDSPSESEERGFDSDGDVAGPFA